MSVSELGIYSEFLTLFPAFLNIILVFRGKRVNMHRIYQRLRLTVARKGPFRPLYQHTRAPTCVRCGARYKNPKMSKDGSYLQ